MSVLAANDPARLAVLERTGTPGATPTVLDVLPSRWHDQADEWEDGCPEGGVNEGVVNGEDRILIHGKAGTCSDTHSHRTVRDTTSLENACLRLQSGNRRWTVVEDTYVLNLAGRGVYSTAVPGEHHHVREAAVVATVALEWLTEVRMLNIVGQHRTENKDIGDGQPSCL